MAIATSRAPRGVSRAFARTKNYHLGRLSALFGLIIVSPAAFADPAPIVYANAKTSKRIAPTQYAAAPIGSAEITGGKRTEYRYPDQPGMVYGEYGPRRLSSTAKPIAFSSSDTAIDEASARKMFGTRAQASYAEINAPHHRASAKVKSETPKLAKQKIGSPYQINGRWYVPAAEPNYDEVGIGSWYGPNFHGKPTANGEKFDQNAMTAAHTTLPIPSIARVTNLENGKSITVRINDRGPFVDNRIIDLSRRAAQQIGYEKAGKARVRVQYLGPAPAQHNAVYVTQKDVQPTDARAAIRTASGMSRRSLGAPSDAGAYRLQLGAFTDIGNAHKLKAKYGRLGETYVEAARVKGRDYFRVYMGPISNKHDAADMKDRLGRDGVNVMVLKLN